MRTGCRSRQLRDSCFYCVGWRRQKERTMRYERIFVCTWDYLKNERNERTQTHTHTYRKGRACWRKRGIKKRAIRQSCDILMILFLTHFFFFFFDDFISHPSHPSFPSAIYFPVITYQTLLYFPREKFPPDGPHFFISPSRVCRVLLYRLTTVILCIVEINGGKENKNNTLFLLK